MPSCTACITGGSPLGACTPSEKTLALRRSIAELTAARFGAAAGLHLYPYLETTTFTSRHAFFAHWMASEAPASVLEIGGYYQPLSRFMHGFCPQLTVTVDPVLPAASYFAPCGESHTHVIVVPATVQEFFEPDLTALHSPAGGKWDAVVCLGCDRHFGPRREQLLALLRPTTLYMEFPVDYVPSAAEFAPLTQAAGVTVLLNATIDTRANSHTEYFKRALFILRLEAQEEGRG